MTASFSMGAHIHWKSQGQANTVIKDGSCYIYSDCLTLWCTNNIAVSGPTPCSRIWEDLWNWKLTGAMFKTLIWQKAKTQVKDMMLLHKPVRQAGTLLFKCRDRQLKQSIKRHTKAPISGSVGSWRIGHGRHFKWLALGYKQSWKTTCSLLKLSYIGGWNADLWTNSNCVTTLRAQKRCRIHSRSEA